jgi:hypothetical protein
MSPNNSERPACASTCMPHSPGMRNLPRPSMTSAVFGSRPGRYARMSAILSPLIVTIMCGLAGPPAVSMIVMSVATNDFSPAGTRCILGEQSKQYWQQGSSAAHSSRTVSRKRHFRGFDGPRIGALCPGIPFPVISGFAAANHRVSSRERNPRCRLVT